MELLEMWGGPDCPVENTLNLISRKWVVAIIRDMYIGKKHFCEFKEYKPSLTNAVLSDTLKFMEENGLVEKKMYNNSHRSNTEYLLTDKSRKLNKVLYSMVEYGIDVLGCDNKQIECYPERMKKEYKELLID